MGLSDIAGAAALDEGDPQSFSDHRSALATGGVTALPRGLNLEIECVAIQRI